MSVGFKMEGFKEIEQALAELPAGTARGVVRRSMKKELQVVADTANAFWPGADDGVFVITSKLAPSQPSPPSGRSIINLFVGADRSAPHAHLIEWGTGPRQHKSGKYVGAVSPSPSLTPAWDMNKAQVLEGLGKRIWAELAATQKRRAAKAAKVANG